VLSVQIGLASDFALLALCQNSQVSGCRPSSCSNFAPHNANANVTPQVPPETSTTAAARTAITTAPTSSGHEPRNTRANPCAVGTASVGGGLRRAWTS